MKNARRLIAKRFFKMNDSIIIAAGVFGTLNVPAMVPKPTVYIQNMMMRAFSVGLWMPILL